MAGPYNTESRISIALINIILLKWDIYIKLPLRYFSREKEKKTFVSFCEQHAFAFNECIRKRRTFKNFCLPLAPIQTNEKRNNERSLTLFPVSIACRYRLIRAYIVGRHKITGNRLKMYVVLSERKLCDCVCKRVRLYIKYILQIH